MGESVMVKKETSKVAKNEVRDTVETLHSKAATVANTYNKYFNKTVSVPKVKLIGEGTHNDVVMERDHLNLVIAALKNPALLARPAKIAKDASDDVRKQYNESLATSTATKLAIRLFAAAGCPTTSLPPMPKGKRSGKVVAPSVKIADVEAFLKDLGIEDESDESDESDDSED